MPTTSNFGWTTPADTDLVKDGAAAIRTLANGIDTSLVDLKGGTTGQILSKNSNTDLDYAWINNDQGDITAVNAGNGISVTDPTGPTPTVAIDSTVATLTGTQTLTNKTIAASSNTITGVINNTLTTTTGDIIYASSANTPARLGIGSSNQVLTVSGGVPTWATPAATTPTFVGWSLKASGLAAGTTSCANATATRILFDDENFDTDGFHSTTTNTARVTIPTGKGGYYLMNIGLEWDANGTGQRQVKLYKNGSALYQGVMIPSATVGPQSRLSLIVNASAGDYFEIFGYQESGGALNCYHTNAVSAFNGSYLGA